MKITITESNGRLDSIVTSHLDEELYWSASTYERRTFKSPKTIFKEINEYWASLPHTRQDAIWNCYKDIYEAIETVNNTDRLTQRLRELVKELYVQTQYDEIDYFVRIAERDKRIVLPKGLKDDYLQDDIKDMTYLLSDYHDLVTLTVALRPMIPIWSEFVRIAKNYTGTTYKELSAFSLLTLTDVIQSKAVDRLQTYVSAMHEGSPKSMAAIMNGMGSVEAVDWLRAKTIVRCICVGELNTGDDNTLITNTYVYIASLHGSTDRAFGGRIIEKYNNFNDSDDDNASRIENYKIRQEVSDGSLKQYSVYVDDYTSELISVVEPGIDRAMVNKCINNIYRQRKTFTTAPHQRVLVQWTLASAVSPRSVEYYYQENMLKVVAATQAILWHRGFHELAVLMTAKAIPINSGTFFNADARSRLTKENVDKLMDRYRYYRKKGRKTPRTRQDNEVITAIDLVIAMLDKNQWGISCPVELLRETTKLPMGSEFPVPYNIRNQLAELILGLRPARAFTVGSSLSEIREK